MSREFQVCDFACDAEATHYVVTATPTGPMRTLLCRRHLDLAHRLADGELCKIIEYGRMDDAWSVHPGGVPA